MRGKHDEDLSLAPSMDGKNVSMTGGMWHCVPGQWQCFDLPDLLAALAPRPLLATDGGVAAALAKVRRVYALAASAEQLEVHHFARFCGSGKRPHDAQPMPEGLHVDEY